MTLTPEMMTRPATVTLTLYEWFQVIACMTQQINRLQETTEAKRLLEISENMEKQLTARRELKLLKIEGSYE